MLIGYARISKADGSQSLDLQRDALREAGVSDDAIYEDQARLCPRYAPGVQLFRGANNQSVASAGIRAEKTALLQVMTYAC